MTTHYLKIALRNMRRFKLQTIVCLTGLAVGMTCFALGTLWLRHIESFEDFVPDGDNIFLVMNGDGMSQFGQGNYYYTGTEEGETLEKNVPGVTDWCSLIYYPTSDNEATIKVGEQELEARLAITEAAYIKMFGIRAEEGSLRSFRDGDVALTRSLARRLFGKEPAVGKEVMLEAKTGQELMPFCVVAVIPDQPENSQFDYELLACSDAVSHPEQKNDGQSLSVYFTNACTFVKFAPSVPRDSILGTHELEFNTEYGKRTKEYTYAPLTELRTNYSSQNVKISTSYVQWFMRLGLLVIACSLFNYLITMVSHLRRRGWEFSLRRVLGSSRWGILRMVGLEALLMFLMATALSVLLTWLVLPFFREYSGITIVLSAIAQRLALYLVLVIVGGMALSALTAWVVMRRTQGNILASRQLKHSSGLLDRLGVVLQMSLSMAIIFCAVVMLMQVRMLMYSDELGFSHADRVVVLNPNEELKARIRQSPLVADSIENATIIFPRRSLNHSSFTPDEEKRRDWQAFKHLCQADFDSTLFNFWQMSLAAGELPVAGKYEDLNKDVREPFIDSNGNTQYSLRAYRVYEVALNEAACALFGWTPETAIGKTLWDQMQECRISAVLHDTYQLGPIVQPEPMIYFPVKQWKVGPWFGTPNFALRAQPGRLGELCDSINAWKEQMDLPEPEFIGMEVINCEEDFEQYISSEQMLIKILFAVGGASLFVCVIGTFSLVSLTLQQRRKEIAIRKVHGARMRDILRLFLRGQIISLAIAAVVAYPISYIIMRNWYNNEKLARGLRQASVHRLVAHPPDLPRHHRRRPADDYSKNLAGGEGENRGGAEWIKKSCSTICEELSNNRRRVEQQSRKS